MSKTVADDIIAGLREAIEYVEGRRSKGMRVWESPSGAIKAAREKRAGAARPYRVAGRSRARGAVEGRT